MNAMGLQHVSFQLQLLTPNINSIDSQSKTALGLDDKRKEKLAGSYRFVRTKVTWGGVLHQV